MKKVVAFVGSGHKRNTLKAVEQFLNKLQALGGVEYEIVTLTDYKLGICRGCRVCFEKGEQYCPLRDDRDVLFEKMQAADGVIFATPNYCWQMSGIMKVFLDRLGFAIHRQRYFGKVFTTIITQGAGRGERIVQDLDYAGFTMGFTTLKGVIVTGFDPKPEKQLQKIDRDLDRHSRRFHALLSKPAYPEPTLFQVMVFRMVRSFIRRKTDPEGLDYRYYADKGWFESDFFYPTHLNPFKKVVGHLADTMSNMIQNIVV